jgi:hypothetical protein
MRIEVMEEGKYILGAFFNAETSFQFWGGGRRASA